MNSSKLRLSLPCDQKAWKRLEKEMIHLLCGLRVMSWSDHLQNRKVVSIHPEKLWCHKMSPGLGAGGLESNSHSVLVSPEAHLSSNYRHVKLRFGKSSLRLTSRSVIHQSRVRHLLCPRLVLGCRHAQPLPTQRQLRVQLWAAVPRTRFAVPNTGTGPGVRFGRNLEHFPPTHSNVLTPPALTSCPSEQLSEQLVASCGQGMMLRLTQVRGILTPEAGGGVFLPHRGLSVEEGSPWGKLGCCECRGGQQTQGHRTHQPLAFLISPRVPE